ncbi:M14 family metallopeptidase [Robiginitalea sp. M366]|uniref:M14 family metallopeptidase n=1 Tax=Robiginitalea aestuariiviva TaxID=3036903 RepID=UPI00240E1B62|nr:M14 family metallopeptidase [Robiginitalea aestuariiviva]MDG1572326.1 M14 family metallopeptidase [Robiginitalea aestuariiviva]
MKRSIFAILLLAALAPAQAQETPGLEYYLPQQISYNPDIPTPESVIGHQVGQWHVTHDKLVQYITALAAASDRMVLENRGTTFEGRPLLLLKVTAPENHTRLDEIRQNHLALTTPGAAAMDLDNMPVVVYQGFSIHGNEPSGANAGLAYAYYLAAAQGPEIEKMLREMVILMDPSFNPDGLQRFAHWANTHKAIATTADPNDREYHEAWPGGRTNHYWFDLNRDWLPVQLPESRARIVTFHDWLPNVLTDHHEMGTNSTFFFQPGEPSRVHPLTPKRNQELTAEIGSYHAKALNKIGSLYYSEEDYDDFYYGKGSTFPDVMGSIGILFEQASSRGHMQESDNGVLTFPFTIRNQFTAALSTIEAAWNMRTKLLDFRRDYYAQLRSESGRGNPAYIFGDAKDAAKARHLAEILHRHRIAVHPLKGERTINGKTYTEGHSYVVPLNQKNPRLIRAMFEKRTSFTDSLFYDISAWTFPLAFNLDYAELGSLPEVGPALERLPELGGGVDRKSQYAYLFQWHEYYTPKVLNTLLQKGIRAKVAREPFRLGGQSYDYGTIMIPVQGQELDPEALYSFLQKTASDTGVQIAGVNTGVTEGIDLGSREFERVRAPKIAMLVGNGIRSYDAGEIWHLLDTRYGIELTKIDTDYLNRADLDRYTDIIVPSSWGTALSERATAKIKEWVSDGGTLIAYTNAANWLKRADLMDLKMRKDSSLVARDIRFDQKQDFLGAQVTGGAIFESRLDRSHPVSWGYKNDRLALFRNSNVYLEPEKNSYDNPIRYLDNPLLSGYISEENAKLISGSVPFKVTRKGSGRVILFTDNTNFRAFWYGTNKLLMNAIFFGHIM